VEKILVGFIIGSSVGGAVMAVAIAFLMGARPDTPKKRMEDAEGLREWRVSKNAKRKHVIRRS
jgi:Na+/H+-translocating membrane pyrophosphatase